MNKGEAVEMRRETDSRRKGWGGGGVWGRAVGIGEVVECKKVGGEG